MLPLKPLAPCVLRQFLSATSNFASRNSATSRTPAARFAALLLVLLPSTILIGQETFSAGDSSQTYGDQFSGTCTQNEKQPTIWKQLGVNPITCHPETAPQSSSKQCDLKGLTPVAHIGETCYYCAANNPPVVLRIPMDMLETASRQNFLCGEDPVDPGCFGLCSAEGGPHKYVPPPQQLSGGGLPAVAVSDPCHPNYDMSTPAGRAAAQASAAQTKAACDAFLCQHNPQLSQCKLVTIQSNDSNYQPLRSSLTVTRLKGNGTATVPIKKNGKLTTLKIKLNIDLGPNFPRTGAGFVTPDPVYNSATGNEPDPDVVNFWGTLDPSETVFTLTRIDFTPGAQKRYQIAPTYNFTAGKQPTVTLSPYQANAN